MALEPEIERILVESELVWTSRDRKKTLYRLPGDAFILHDTSPLMAPYLGIQEDGEVKDLTTGEPPDGGDIESAIQAFGSAGLREMQRRVIHWPHRRRR